MLTAVFCRILMCLMSMPGGIIYDNNVIGISIGPSTKQRPAIDVVLLSRYIGNICRHGAMNSSADSPL